MNFKVFATLLGISFLLAAGWLAVWAGRFPSAATPELQMVSVSPELNHVPVVALTDPIALSVEVQNLQGETVRLGDYGGQFVLINFWASYCPYCRIEMPALEAVSQRYENLIVLGVNTGESPSIIRSFQSEVGVSYPLLIDRWGKASTAFETNCLPATYLLDPQGQVVWKRLGVVDAATLDQVLDDRITKGTVGETTP